MKFKKVEIVIIILFILFFNSGCIYNDNYFNNHNLNLISSYDNAHLFTTENNKIYVLELRGTYYEMGKQYGYLMKEQLNDFYNDIIIDYLINERNRTYEEIKNFAFEEINYYPKRYINILKGMSETSGLGYEKQVILNSAFMFTSLDMLNEESLEFTGCSGFAVWGNYSLDEKLIFARNWDMDNEIFTRYMKYLTVVIFNPINFENSVAKIHPAGIIYIETAINDKGIFLELNNAGPYGDLNEYDNRLNLAIVLFDFLSSYSTIEQFDAAFHSTRPGYGYLVNIADKNLAQSYEWMTFDTRIRIDDNSGFLAVTNNPVHPLPKDWVNKMPIMPNNADELDPRRNNLINLAKKNKGQIDFDLMKDLYLIEIEDGGATMTNLINKTTFQVIAIPEDLIISIRIPFYSEWQDINLSNHFY
jgi:hypothetical protein